MSNTIHRNFTQVADAESARNALLAGGFPASSVTLNQHRAPPSDVATSTVENIVDALTPGGAAAAAKARERSGALLSVDIDDDDQRSQADAIMGKFGASEA